MRFDGPKTGSCAPGGRICPRGRWKSLPLTTIVEARPSRSKPGRGVLVTDVELINQDDGRPISFRAVNFLLRRPT